MLIIKWIQNQWTRYKIVGLLAAGKPITGKGRRECAELYDDVMKKVG